MAFAGDERRCLVYYHAVRHRCLVYCHTDAPRPLVERWGRPSIGDETSAIGSTSRSMSSTVRIVYGGSQKKKDTCVETHECVYTHVSLTTQGWGEARVVVHADSTWDST